MSALALVARDRGRVHEVVVVRIEEPREVLTLRRGLKQEQEVLRVIIVGAPPALSDLEIALTHIGHAHLTLDIDELDVDAELLPHCRDRNGDLSVVLRRAQGELHIERPARAVARLAHELDRRRIARSAWFILAQLTFCEM